MKKTIRVVITKEIEMEIPDKQLTPEALHEFECHMFYLGDDKILELFQYAACHAARFPSHSFIEGIGSVEFGDMYEDVESEEVED